MARATEVFPVFVEDEQGEQQLHDFQVQHAHSGGEVEQEFTFDQYGNVRYEFEDDVFESDENDTILMEEYSNSLHEAYPELNDALAWAAANLDPATVQGFNEAIAEGDDEEIEVSDEDVNAVVEEMQEAEPMGQEFALPYLEAAVESQATNPLYSDWCANTAKFHSGEITWDQAMDDMTSRYSMSDLAKMYNYFQQHA